MDSELKPGFTRVFIPEKGRTTRIRTYHANNRNYMAKHGLVPMDEATPPPPPAPVQAKPQVTKAQPIKVKI